MTIPEIRSQLLELARHIADDAQAAQLRFLAEATRRRAPVRRAAPKRKGLTPSRVAEIQAFAKANPSMAYHDIANALGVGHGRVSEALAGKRE